MGFLRVLTLLLVPYACCQLHYDTDTVVIIARSFVAHEAC